VNTWLAPDTGVGLDGFLRLAPENTEWSLRVAGVYGSGTTYVGERRAEFAYGGGRAEACPISRGFSWNLLAEGCLAGDFGALRGRGETSSALARGNSQTVFWAAAILVARVRARFGNRLLVEGQGELGLPLVRPEFVFDDPRERIFLPPTLGFGGRVGLGVNFL
jgi:hypothetical protein